jgi:hypothetical protein
MVSNSGLDNLVGELSTVLDQQAQLLASRLAQMLALREAIVGFDNDALEKVLEQMERTISDQSQCDTLLRQVSRRTARAAGCENSNAPLRQLIDILPPRHAAMLERRRAALIDQAGVLRGKHMEISMLLREYARVNREILERLLPGGNTVTVYGSSGRENWRASSGIVNLEF